MVIVATQSLTSHNNYSQSGEASANLVISVSEPPLISVAPGPAHMAGSGRMIEHPLGHGVNNGCMRTTVENIRHELLSRLLEELVVFGEHLTGANAQPRGR